MIRRTPECTRTDTRLPYTTLFPSVREEGIAAQRRAQRRPPLRIHRHAGGAARRGAGKVVAAFPGFDERHAAEEPAVGVPPDVVEGVETVGVALQLLALEARLAGVPELPVGHRQPLDVPSAACPLRQLH